MPYLLNVFFYLHIDVFSFIAKLSSQHMHSEGLGLSPICQVGNIYRCYGIYNRTGKLLFTYVSELFLFFLQKIDEGILTWSF